MKVRDIVIVVCIAGEQSKVVFKCSSSNDQVQRAGSDPFILLSECFSKLSTALCHGKREREYGDSCEKSIELSLRLCSVGAPYYTLINLHVGDNAYSNTVLCQLVQKLYGLLNLCEVINDPVGIDKVRHWLSRAAVAVLLAGRVNIG